MPRSPRFAWVLASALALGASLLSRDAAAIRPFVTDDARVVGAAQVQLETWGRVAHEGYVHTALGAVGPTRWLEITAGGAAGYVERSTAVGGLVAQGKILAIEAQDDRAPGLAIAFGALPGIGRGALRGERSAFGYLALTQPFRRERVLIHGNLGLAVSPERRAFTAGIGAQLRVAGRWCAVGETYLGDPYAPAARGTGAQLGTRLLLSDHVQIDATVGTPLADWAPFATFGLRVVSSPLF